MKTTPTIAFDIAPSRVVVVALGCVTLLAAIAPWLSVLSAPARVTVSALLIAGAVRTAASFIDRRYRRIALGASGWTLLDAQGAEHAAILQSQTRLGRCIALVFRAGPRRRFTTLLLPDNCDAETRRRLILLLATAGDEVPAH